jgi:hypothetical protein
MRLYWNELQQAETDSFMGSQRDMLENIRRQVQRVDDDLRTHVDQWTTDAGVLEDSIDGLRFGLSEIGGFVRYNELSRDQRTSMMTQERANMVMHDMRRRAPESTDPETPERPSTTAVPTSSLVPRAVRTGVYYEGEEHEEESPTDDEMGENEIQEHETELSNLMRNLRRLQNEAIASERFEDASDLQTSILACLNAARDNTGLNAELITTVRNCFQRLYRKNRNKGNNAIADMFHTYVEDFQLATQ